MSVFGRRHLPALDGATGWINTEPLSPDDLRDHVVLVNFWTLTCINWLRTVPYIRAWAETYRDDGLIVLGVHTPEFGFEHEIDSVRHATADRGLTYPVALDNEYSIWRAFDNHYWPALYFVDREGVIRHHHFGEGRYEESERTMQELLGVERDFVSVAGLGVEAEADWQHLKTFETYLGYVRSDNFVSPGGAVFDTSRVYELPAVVPLNSWALDGAWTLGPETVVLEQTDGSIAYRFHARDVHLVLSNGARAPIPFRVLVDGEPPGPSHGVDVDEDGNGLLGDGRLYQLVRARDDVRDRTLVITFLEPGAEAHAFTFG